MGTGLGTFSLASPMYQPPASGEILDKMHNDYLELMVTSGFSSLILFLMAAGLFRVGLVTFKEVRLKAFTFLGVLAVAVHAMGDFPFQNISITWLLALWLGISFVKEKQMIPVPSYVKILLLLFGVIMLPTQFMRTASALTGGSLFPSFSPRLITENLYQSRTSGKCSDWINVAEQVAVKHLRYAPLRAEIARCYESLDDYDKALEYMEEAVKQEPYNIQMRLSAAKLCYMQGKWDRAVEHLISARSVGTELKFMIPLEPDLRDSVLINGNRRYVDLYPYRGILSYRSTIVQLRKWKSNLVWPMIKEGLARYPSSVELMKQAMDYFSGARPERSLQFATISYSIEPESAIAYKAAHFARDAGRHDDAETWFVKALEDPDNASRYAIRAPKFVLDRSQALEIMISQFNRDPHPILAYYIGSNYDNHNDVIEASRWYEQAIGLRSDYAPIYRKYYDMMVRQGDATMVSDILRRARTNLDSENYQAEFVDKNNQ